MTLLERLHRLDGWEAWFLITCLLIVALWVFVFLWGCTDLSPRFRKFMQGHPARWLGWYLVVAYLLLMAWWLL